MPNVNANSVQAVLKIAFELANEAEPLVRKYGPEAQAAVEKYGPQALDAGKKAAAAAGAAVGAGAGFVGGAAKHVGSAAVGVAAGAANAARDKAAHAHDERERNRIISEARRSTIAASAYSAPADDFEAASTAATAADLPIGGFMSLPGCYAILVLPSSRTKDLSTFKEVYVGCASKLGASVHDQLIGRGNPDIYADRKYGQTLHVLLFPCDEAGQKELKDALMLNLQAFASYNAREEGASEENPPEA